MQGSEWNKGLNMKLGVSTLALIPTPLEDVLTCLEDREVGYCEVINEFPYNTIDQDVVGSYNVKITVHSPLSDVNIASYNETMRNSSVSQIKESIEIASEMDPGIVVVHPGHVPILGKKFEEKIIENSIKSLGECAEYAADCGVMLCIENMPDIEGLLCKDVHQLADIVEELDCNMTLDVGHAHNMKFSIQDMLNSPRIKHIHLSDNDGSYDDHDAIGSKTLDFETLFNDLKKIDYDGVLVVEVKDPQAVSESLRFLKNHIH